MKRVYVNEAWCLGCHLCEYNCAFANSGRQDMAAALKGKPIYPRIHIEGQDAITYAVSCRHCTDPICVKSCIAGAISSATAISILVFSLLYTPCVAAIASVKRELGVRWAAGVIVWQCVIAYAAAGIAACVCMLCGV